MSEVGLNTEAGSRLDMVQVHESEALHKSAASGRLPTLDGLRAISIMLVILGHLTGTRNFPHWLDFFGLFANFGVRVFFVISGFLITSLLLKELRKRGSISLKDFYIRRVLRIFPAFYVYLLVIAFLALGAIKLRHNDLLFAFTYTMNFHFDHSWYVAHLWSLAVEEQFYLVWPALLAFLSRELAFRAAAVTFLSCPLIRLGIWYLFPQGRDGIGHMFPTVADVLAIGCLLAGWREWLHQRTWYMNLLQRRPFLLITLLALMVNLSQDRPRIYIAVGESIMNLCIAICIDRCMTYSSFRLGRVLEWKPLAFIGVLSYSLYIWQQPFLNRNSPSPLSAFPINILVVVFAALASYYMIEQPFLKLKSRFNSSPIAAESVTAEVARSEPA
jgi:peptidoglycan/LPS O-acetylase OafA/YrhL